MKKNILLLIVGLLSAGFVWSETVTFTAAEICAGTTKKGVTASSTVTATENQQVCKEGGKAKKEAILKIGSTASTMDQNNVCISSTSDIKSVKIHGTINSSGNKNIAMLMWNVSGPTATATSEQLVSLGGYDGDCSANTVDVNVPSGIKSFKLFRQLKKYDTSTHTVVSSGGANYGDGTTFYVVDMTLEVGPTGPSTDAHLSSIKYDGTPIAGFDTATYSYEVELPATYTSIPNVECTTVDTGARAAITQPTAVPGTATIVVTAEDKTTQKTYTVTFTKASNAPKVTSATWTNITAAGATVDNVGMTITGQVANGTRLTAITPTFTGNNIQSWTPNTATNFSAGAVPFTFTSPTSEQTVYNVTITEAPPVSSDATLKSLTVANHTLNPDFSANVTSYQVDVTDANVPQTSAEANHSAATVQITQASSVTGTTKVKVTAEDGTTTKEYQITFNTVVPPSELAIHKPGMYEDEYKTPIVTQGNRSYEVYYTAAVKKNGSDRVTVVTTGGTGAEDPSHVISTDETESSFKGEWFKGSITSVSNGSVQSSEEFTQYGGQLKVYNNDAVEIHVQGFDQFSFLGQDNNATESKGKHFEVYIDNIKQAMTLSSSLSIRRFDISTAEHLIKIVGVGGSNNYLYGFSLRETTDPQVKYCMGNDSNQHIYQTRKLNPIVYTVKNNVNNTQVVWTSGTPATGIDLVAHGSSGVKDTLMLQGNANCPVGTYTYRIVAYDAGGVEKSSSDEGTFTVSSLITATTDTIVTGYDGWSMDPIEFSYYAMDASQIHLTWTGATPGGVSGAGTDGIYQITGTPTAQGTYPYTISVDGGNTLSGKLIVEHLELGNNPILYMYKGTTDKDGTLAYLKTKYSVMAATQTSVANMTEVQKNKFKVIVIGESTDANFQPALDLIKSSTIPVLNMQIFAYNPSRLNWGMASNGSAKNGIITVVQPSHPIFKAMAATAGQKINLLDSVVSRGLVNAEVYHKGSWCLASAAIRGEEYVTDAEQQTFLHEVSATERGSKYICLPIAKASSAYLSTSGKRLIEECLKYLMDGSKSPIALPTLQITSFKINGIAGVIDEANKEIVVSASGDFSAATPVITLADPTTFVTPASGEAVDFSNPFIGVTYTVSDYINTVTYTVYRRNPAALEDVYMPGEWVNIYNMQGIKVMTTNEDVHQLSLPRGVYIVQTATQSFKIFK